MHQIREIVEDDRAAAIPLIDSAIGRGFWDPDKDLGGIVRVASVGDRLLGVGAASIDSTSPDTLALPVPVGHIRLVAVAPEACRQDIATGLVSELSRECAAAGVASLLAYVRVHATTGAAPLGGALERAGYALGQRIRAFYAAVTDAPCPVCGQSPCGCPADVYYRILDSAGSRQAFAPDRSGLSSADMAMEER